jgi:hypothetical protein
VREHTLHRHHRRQAICRDFNDCSTNSKTHAREEHVNIAHNWREHVSSADGANIAVFHARTVGHSR